MDDEPREKKQSGGAPAWIMTFADLMSLLMCFFVLLLSFSEMDVSKYKQIAGSMKDAFGVQRKYSVKEPPKGINVIAQEFSSGRPDPTPFNVMEQMTTQDMKLHLEGGDKARKHKDGEDGRQGGGNDGGSRGEGRRSGADNSRDKPGIADDQLVLMPKDDAKRLLEAKQAAEQQRKLEQTANQIRSALKQEIESGQLDVLTEERKIIIRIRDKASFTPGGSMLRDSFRPILVRVGQILNDTEGQIRVAGHTDDLPVKSGRYRSNWELSASRAASVVEAMLASVKMDPKRLSVLGLGDTQPVVPNDNPADRARNRRVEIVLVQGKDLAADTAVTAQPASPESKAPPKPQPQLQPQSQPDSQKGAFTAPPQSAPPVQGKDDHFVKPTGS